MSVLNNVLEGLDSKSPMPGLPEETDLVLWTMYYRHGNNPHCLRTFEFEDNMKTAHTRARTHCDKMGYNLTYIRRTIEDLEEIERKYTNGG